MRKALYGHLKLLTFVPYLKAQKNLNIVKSKKLDSLAQSKEFLTVNNG